MLIEQIEQLLGPWSMAPVVLAILAMQGMARSTRSPSSLRSVILRGLPTPANSWLMLGLCQPSIPRAPVCVRGITKAGNNQTRRALIGGVDLSDARKNLSNTGVHQARGHRAMVALTTLLTHHLAANFGNSGRNAAREAIRLETGAFGNHNHKITVPLLAPGRSGLNLEEGFRLGLDM
jgi:hypothetical protein